MSSPPDNLNLSLSELATRYGVSRTTARHWKRDAGIPLKRGRPGVRRDSLAREVTHEEWAKGCHYVARLLAISPQAAWMVRNRLIAEGLDLPVLRKGRGRQLRKGSS